MQKPTVSYKGFKLSKIFEPQYSHLLLLLGWVVYFVLFFLTENLVPGDACHPMHCTLDDIIPFCEIFVLPYVLWYVLIAGSLLYFALYNVTNFKRLQIYIMITQAIGIACYIIYPTCQNLRPEIFQNNNFFTDIIGLLYSVDTNTGVCPSLHCAYSIGIASVWLREKSASKLTKWLITLFCISVCLSTVFIKQHSVIDFFAALPVCLVAELIIFKDIYFKKKPKKITGQGTKMDVKMNFNFSSKEENGIMNYGVFFPDDYTDLPLLIYLHGAGERGLNYDHIYRHGVGRLIGEGREIPAVVLIPQCPEEFVWDNVVVDLKKIIDTVAKEYAIKPDRICITGSSMGGFGTWMMGLTYKNFFSGLAPIAGGGMAWRTMNLKNTPVYAIHGSDDEPVNCVYSKMMCQWVNNFGGNAKLTILDGFGHNDGIYHAYYHTDVIDWLLNCRRTDFENFPEAYSENF